MMSTLQRPLAGGRVVPHPATAGHGLDWPIWWVTFLSLAGWNLAIGVSAVLMAGFLLTWVLYFLAWPARGLDQILRTPLPFTLPVLALVSTLWSQAPAVTLRNAVQMLLATGIGVLIARAQSARSFIAAFMCVMILSVVLGVMFGGTAPVGIQGDTALIGIFGSKNSFALMISFAMLSSAAVLLDSQQPWPLRLLSIFGCMICPPLLLLAKSVGAFITLGVALGCLGIFALAGRMPTHARPAVYIAALFLALVALGVVLLLQSSGALEELLRSTGKDTNLTGRTYLWLRARLLISLNPVLGVGYQAFWVQESIEAEGLWRFSNVTSRAGFHMHNLYYETAVELGYLGVVVLGVTLGAVILAVVVAAFRCPCPEHAFFAALALLLGTRAYVELDFLSPFSSGTLLIPVLWTYCSQAVRSAPRVVMRPPAMSVALPG